MRRKPKTQGPGRCWEPPDSWYEARLENQGYRRCQDCQLAFKPKMDKQFFCPACRTTEGRQTQAEKDKTVSLVRKMQIERRNSGG